MTNEIEQLSEQLYFSDIEKLVSAGHSVKIPIQGNSMYPFLIDGRDRVSIFFVYICKTLIDIVTNSNNKDIIIYIILLIICIILQQAVS